MKALNGIHNAAEDFEIARRLFEETRERPGLVPALSHESARLADDLREAFGSFEAIANANNRGDGARALASFGAMARELRALQDRVAKAEADSNTYRGQRDWHAAEALALEESLTAHAKRSASLDSRLTAYRKACDKLTFGELRLGSAAMRRLWESYESDAAAFVAEERD